MDLSQAFYGEDKREKRSEKVKYTSADCSPPPPKCAGELSRGIKMKGMEVQLCCVQ